jgi:GT2 family glycosyltransferase
MEKLLTIQLLGWNGAGHLVETARALRGISLDAVVIRYIDNGSRDASLEIIQDILPHADIIRFEENQGFAKAHNAGFAACETKYVLTLDQDITLVWEGIQNLIEYMEKNSKVGAVQGKMYRKGSNKVLDSAGIIATLALNGRERGSHEKDTGQYEQEAPLFAVTGGCGMYRMEALKQVEYFDEDFFAYKEDVDLGWRLNNADWVVRYIPTLVGYHARTLGRRGIFNWGISPRAISERLASPRTRWSLRNYIWMLMKNMSWEDEVKHDFFIIGRLFVFFLLSLFSSQLFSVWKETFKGIPKMIAKRKSRT